MSERASHNSASTPDPQRVAVTALVTGEQILTTWSYLVVLLGPRLLFKYLINDMLAIPRVRPRRQRTNETALQLSLTST